ncbi:uncharacterized protein BXZ73DRAFT_107219 [Epithele typhae]|uniref:uncharacterized protein n=1 Tax=Epithele typhae TaxID=378194 RepID=UPI002007632A|nr:uncharacterized protein BXZ73DRAFT_107219 [Epithele typhae]KAH9912771.1 hypothetical protein BXZ73DRAFT_107219 [Epithele typhae]
MSAPSTTGPRMTHPLPLSSTLHDLALLRASDLDLGTLLPSPTTTDESTAPDEVEASAARSREFAKEARAALKLANTDAAEREGARVDGIRARLEDALEGVDGKDL